MSDDHTLRIERTYQAPAEAVFDAWTSTEVIRRWWQAERGWETSEAEIDLRVGGVVRVVMREPDGGAEHGGGGTYTEIDRPSRLAFTWTWDGSDRGTLIEVDFAPTGTGTRVSFTHSRLADEESLRDHEYGWSNILDQLGRQLGEGSG